MDVVASDIANRISQIEKGRQYFMDTFTIEAINNISTLIETHNALRENIIQLRKYYTIQLNAVILNAFFNIIFEFFLVYEQVSSAPIYVIIATLSQGLLHLTEIYLLFSRTNALKKQIIGAVNTLHRKFNGILPMDLRRCMEMFSITNLHHQFISESRELYKLDNGALYAVILSVLTYLVFLVQIKLDE
ncbi:uncharacterized protein LOC116342615 [Contarinia nasturtii]|uniref:uncharacterized protein LOC116342615 n=1 Tax=Contarinia nasturtii TaxID=265458 RepID=UPI0012D3F868|nr:uncharacterized protein LOC116342615 [Contarinia nasturtii]